LKNKPLSAFSDLVTNSWDWEKNARNPEELSSGSSISVWWKCSEGHSFRRQIGKYINSNRCPTCNSAGAKSKRARDFWHPSKNKDLTPFDVYPTSNKKLWWQCSKGHEWEASVGAVVRSTGCPVCNRLVPSPEFNFATKFPTLLKEWDRTKNELVPEQVLPGSDKKIWWVCKKGHSYQAAVKYRTRHGDKGHGRGGGCPYCSGRRVSIDRNLVTQFPITAREWHPTKNLDLKPDQVPPHSNKNVWWRCDEGHEWETKILNRTSGGTNCPYCANRLVSKTNSLAAVFPEISVDWDNEKNQGKTPDDFIAGSNSKVFWKCKFGHFWEAAISARTHGGSGCPKCKPQASRIEIRIYTELLYYFEDTLWGSKIGGYECDVYVPSLGFGVEFDGAHWHKGKNDFDLKKNNVFEAEGVKLLRIRERPLEPISENDIVVKKGELEDNVLKGLYQKFVELRLLPLDVENDISKFIENPKFKNSKAYRKILALLPAPPSEAALSATHPGLSSEWNYARNAPLKPDNFSYGSTRVVWWICPIGHEYDMRIAHRTDGINCPICAGRRVSEDRNFAVSYPALARQWNYEKNGKISPEDISHGSGKRIWWKCDRGHEWDAIVSNQVKARKGEPYCPFCEHRLPSPEYNLGISNPELSIIWSRRLNDNSDMASYLPSSNKKIWWECPKKHVWQSSIYARVKAKTLCPVCKTRKVEDAD
jgi:hypothetical protein